MEITFKFRKYEEHEDCGDICPCLILVEETYGNETARMIENGIYRFSESQFMVNGEVIENTENIKIIGFCEYNPFDLMKYEF